MEESFQQYLQRPENRALVESLQKKEQLKSLKKQERATAKDFQTKVLASNAETRQIMAPFFKHPALRRVIHTFTNDEDGDMGRWACNPEVQRMLSEAKRLLDEGRISEKELERLLNLNLEDSVKQGQIPGNPTPQAQPIVLDTEDLISALNEHLMERRRGNERYRAKEFPAAKHHYERAKAILENVRGLGQAEQDEITTNRVTVLLNLAALHMATQQGQLAIQCCSQALSLDPKSCKALLRRAKSHLKIHNYQAARADLKEIRIMRQWTEECEEVGCALMEAEKCGAKTDTKLFSKMILSNLKCAGTEP